MLCTSLMIPHVPTENSLTSPVIKYALTWFVVFGLFTLIIVFSSSITFSLQLYLATISSYVLASFDLDVVQNGVWLMATDAQNRVIVDEKCTGLFMCSGLLALVIAASAPLKKKLFYAVLILLFIQLLNILRISHLYYVGLESSSEFDFYHLVVWQTINLLVVFLIAFFVYRGLIFDSNVAARPRFQNAASVCILIVAGAFFYPLESLAAGGGGGGGGASVPFIGLDSLYLLIPLLVATPFFIGNLSKEFLIAFVFVERRSR